MTSVLRAAHVLLPAIIAFASRLEAQPMPGTAPLRRLCDVDATPGSPEYQTRLILNLAIANPLVDSATAIQWPVTIPSQEPFSASAACGKVLRPLLVRAWYNTTRPRTDRDGAVWQGRGATVAVSGGISFRRDAIGVAIRPIIALAENASFPLADGSPGADFRDPYWGTNIDMPRRFGDGVSITSELGETYAEVRWRLGAAGISTMTQQWGPAHYYPLVLGAEAAGFPRLFAEVIVPTAAGDATVHWQIGQVRSSPYATDGRRRHAVSALRASMRVATLPGLQLGGARFFHVADPNPNWEIATLPFSGLLKNSSRDAVVGGQNQIASIWARVAPARSGVELYGEFYREDHNADMRDLASEPDHQSAYTLGLRRAWRRSGGVSAVTIERTNGLITHLARVRPQSPIYTHSPITEGHTHAGQLLGASASLGTGTLVAWSRMLGARSWDIITEILRPAQITEGVTWLGRRSEKYRLDAIHGRQDSGRRTTIGFGVELSKWPTQYFNLTARYGRTF